ncbi:MAG: YlxR family protein [Chloroflexi bacterium]|nr:YlxR family protein [Chloroflexota bacterium]
MTAATRERRQQVTETRRKPQRTCIACRQTRAKHELVRVVRSTSEVISVDSSGKLSGRGAYLCANDTCWERGLRGSYLENRLLLGAPLSSEDRDRIRHEARTVIQSRRDGEVTSP